ncbi:hypothetical protein QAD02_002490 [Eretmocerus hayati]|uniref:Uncharacterized protein n=1 Tax=Eretmocerus hayati TaxID=131215 RepID=A0ACC2NKT4_9HYME|nr:hypothetical protein QAD02_002490 [Eretmocerus hayati]
MPKILCNKCKTAIPRASSKILCVDCGRKYHSDCIREFSNQGILVRRCDNCLAVDPAPSNHIASTVSSLAIPSNTKPHEPTQPYEQLVNSNSRTQTPSLCTAHHHSRTPPNTNTPGKRQRSTPSPTSLTQASKFQRLNSPPNIGTMTSNHSQRELDLLARREEIERSAPDWHQLFQIDYRAASIANEKRVANIEKKSDCILQALTHTDENGIKISGIPSTIQAPIIDSAVKILQLIGLTSPLNFILQHREWPMPADKNSERVVVVKFVGGVRETVLRNAYKLKDMTAQSIFGVGGNVRIYINQVYPRAVFNLLREARKASKSLNYATPLVKNMIVFMRETQDSELILIKDSTDIRQLQPRIVPPRSEAVAPSDSPQVDE